MDLSELNKIMAQLQDSPDIVADMHGVFIHWLNESIDHSKRDMDIWEHQFLQTVDSWRTN